MGLVMALRTATTVKGGVDDVSRYYRAARVYNSGSVDPSGDLGQGVATHCYASDVANRLRGWSLGTHGCGEGGVGGVVGVERLGEGRVGVEGLKGEEGEGGVEKEEGEGGRDVRVGLMGVGMMVGVGG